MDLHHNYFYGLRGYLSNRGISVGVTLFFQTVNSGIPQGFVLSTLFLHNINDLSIQLLCTTVHLLFIHFQGTIAKFATCHQLELGDISAIIMMNFLKNENFLFLDRIFIQRP